jgi:hypothetical protein
MQPPIHIILPISFSFFEPETTRQVKMNITIALWNKMPNNTTKFCNIYIIMRKFDQVSTTTSKIFVHNTHAERLSIETKLCNPGNFNSSM